MPRLLAVAAIALLALAPLAFWPAYLSQLSVADGYTHAHAALGTCWLLLLLIQPLLIQASCRSWHRRCGRIGVVVGAAFVISGVLIAHRSVTRLSIEQFAREGHFVYLPLAMAAIFAAALVLAVQWRQVASVHGRFMAATALALLDPLCSRLLFFYAPPLPAAVLYQVPAFGLSLAALLAMLVSLPTRSPGRPAFLYFCAGVAAVLLGFFFIPTTAPWLSFATWFRELPLT